jgi:translation elongation factor P/translation initiation factor 5A
MSSAEQLRKGMVLRHEGRTCMMTDFFTALSGERKAVVHLELCVSTSTRQYIGEEH